MGKHSYSKQELRELKRNMNSRAPQHSLSRKKNSGRKVLISTLTVSAVVIVSGGFAASYAVNRVVSNFETVDLVSVYTPQAAPIKSEKPFTVEPVEEVPQVGSFDGAFNIVIVGSDTREGQAGNFGSSRGELNDVNILMSVNEDHTQAAIISFPRDLIVTTPECVRDDGSTVRSRTAALNTVLSNGGLPCVARTVESIMQVPVMYAGMLTFNGVADVSTAVGGVPVCVAGPLKDKYSGLNLPEAGVYELEGEEALAFLRTRYNVGDGSDLSRIGLQQLYLSSLLRKMVEEDVLNNFVKLYAIADTISRSAVLSSSLANVDVMVSMARTFNNIPLENVVFVMFPVGSGGEAYPGKVVAKNPSASDLIKLVSSGEMFQISDPAVRGTFIQEGGSAELVEGLATLSGVVGQSAADLTCTKTR
jgi:LCP family protein required for cell wall assembly